jgi:DNA-binding LacI/PurR family transcriptional regulator
MASLREVARAAGVSVATASRVANGIDSVRPETRERVRRAMQELMYVQLAEPGAMAAIALLVPELANPVFPALAEAMETRAKKHGFASILCNTGGSVDAEADYVIMLLERQVAGMIFISCEGADLRAQHSHYRRLLRAGAQLVFVNGGPRTVDAPVVGIDERAAGRLATQHLLSLGHERIGFVAGPSHYVPTQEKAEGRVEALTASRIPPNGFVAHGEFSIAGGRRAMSKLLGTSRPPTGVICSSDLMAIGAMREGRARGLRIPEDLSIVGFDGIEATTWTEPAITTVEQPLAEIAEMAVNALVALIEDPDRHMPNFLFRPRMRTGASTAPPR